jgi:hypothetical protein
MNNDSLRTLWSLLVNLRMITILSIIIKINEELLKITVTDENHYSCFVFGYVSKDKVSCESNEKMRKSSENDKDNG